MLLHRTDFDIFLVHAYISIRVIGGMVFVNVDVATCNGQRARRAIEVVHCFLQFAFERQCLFLL